VALHAAHEKVHVYIKGFVTRARLHDEPWNDFMKRVPKEIDQFITEILGKE
jgi:hypothetical protein